MEKHINNFLISEKSSLFQGTTFLCPRAGTMWQTAHGHFRAAKYARQLMRDKENSQLDRDQAVVSYTHHVDALMDSLAEIEERMTELQMRSAFPSNVLEMAG